MDDYIKRDSVVAYIENLCNKAGNDDMCFSLNWVSRHIKEMSAADVRENVRGEWFRTEAYPHRIYCSVCYETYLYNEKWAAELPITLHPNYCPNCAADMRR